MADTLNELRRLVQAKKYDEARQMLQASGHPKAHTWLAQLEARIAREKSGLPAAPPKKISVPVAEKSRRLPSVRALATIALVIAALCLGAYFLWDNLTPHTYDDAAVTVTYPPNWKIVGVGRVDECNSQPEGRRCLVTLVRAPEYLTKIIVIEQDLTAPTTLDDYQAQFWERVRTNANAVLQEQKPVTLDGQPAVMLRYDFSFDRGSGSEMSLSMIRGQKAYQVFANAEKSQTLLDDLDEVWQILDTLHFKQE